MGQRPEPFAPAVMAPSAGSYAHHHTSSTPSVQASVRSRHDSLASASDKATEKSDVVDHSLDNIHYSASRSAVLTTFNDFNGPPPTPAPDPNRGLASQLQSGLGGVYSRFKATVGGGPSAPSSPTTSRPQTRDSNGRKSPESQRSSIAAGNVPKLSRGRGSSVQAQSSPSRRSFASQDAARTDSKNGRASRQSGSQFSTTLDTEKPEKDLHSRQISAVFAQEESLPGATMSDTTETQIPSLHDFIDANRVPKMHQSRLSDVSTIASRRAEKLGLDDEIATTGSSNSRSVTPSRHSRNNSHDSEHRPPMTLQVPSVASFDLPQAISRDSFSARSNTPLHSADFRRDTNKLSAASSLLAAQRDSVYNGQMPPPRAPPSRVLTEMRRKVISRDFWMKDENAKVCFNCGDRFSTFRRKHHCRTCGQIFDAKCTDLISGTLFGQDGRIRVCKICEAMIHGDDSSDYSEDDDAVPTSGGRQIRFSNLPTEPKTSLPSSLSQTPLGESLGRSSDHKKRPPSSYFDNHQGLPRPASSRSLKSLSSRPRSASHRHRRSRHQNNPSLTGVLEAGTPFPYAQAADHTSKASDKFSAFHSDSIIDPELAQFMSDDEASDDELISLDTVLEGPDLRRRPSLAPNPDGTPLRTRPKSSRSILDFGLGRDNDILSNTAKIGLRRKQLGVRTISTGSLVQRHITTPRVVRSENLFSQYDTPYSFPDDASAMDDKPLPVAEYDPQSRPETRHGHQTVELNKTCMDYVKEMLSQFLNDEKFSDQSHWQKILIPVILRCAHDVDPNISRGDNIDVRHYIKTKRAPGGTPKDTRYVSGVVFTKNLALKGMPRYIKHPRILLISFALEYARHQRHFMSLEPLIAQEREYLKKLVNRIDSLGTHVLLVQRNVSGIALEFLEQANIAVAYNVKESALRAVARCTNTRVITSVDKLTMNRSNLGTCDTFELRTWVHERKKKTHMYFSGCQKDLGCTVVLRGASADKLSKLKQMLEFMCYVAYNLKLESSLMRDEFISMSGPDLNRINKSSGATDKEANNPVASDPFLQDDGLVSHHSEQVQDAFRVAPSAYGDMVKQLRKRLLSVSPYVKLPEPFLLLRGYEQEKQMKKLWNLVSPHSQQIEDEKQDDKLFELVQPEMVDGAKRTSSPQIREVLRAIHRSEYDKALHRYKILKRRWEIFLSSAVEPFSPLSHQYLVALFSIVSTKTADPCKGPDPITIDFYQEQPMDDNAGSDYPLGEFVEHLCLQVDQPCPGHHCDQKMIDHHRQYVHGDGQVSIYVEKMPSKIRGLENTILMWSTCRQCDYESQVTPMSSSAWKYSFGKYLELSFWCQPLHPRVGNCIHDVHKDHLRCFGFQGVTLRVQYDPVNIMEVTVPRLTVGWKVDKDLNMKNGEYTRIEDRLTKFMTSVKTRIRCINLGSIEPEKLEECKEAIGLMIKRASDEHDMLLQKLRDKYAGSKFYEIIPLNRAVRALQERVAEWDSTFADFEQKYFPSEKDIRKLAIQQLRKAYIPRIEQINEDDEKAINYSDIQSPQTGDNPEVLPSDAQNETNLFLGQHEPKTEAGSLQVRDEKTVEHLDLAVPSPKLSPADLSVNTSSAQNLQTAMEDITQRSTERTSIAQTDAGHRVDQIPDTISEPHAHPISPQTPQRSPLLVSPTSVQRPISPQLLRSATSPTVPTRKSVGGASSTPLALNDQIAKVDWNTRHQSLIPTPAKKGSDTSIPRTDRHGHERVTTALASGRAALQSMIPRPIRQPRPSNKVSALAKHFEAMSREFERERLRERRQRAERNRQSRVYPLSSFRPVVQVFRDAQEAVREPEMTDQKADDPKTFTIDESTSSSQRRTSTDRSTSMLDSSQTFPSPAVSLHESPVDAGPTSNDECLIPPRSPASDTEIEAIMSDSEPTLVTSSREDSTREDNSDLDTLLSLEDSTGDLAYDIPRHDKNSLMKMLTSFWSERSASGWNPLEYPLLASDHIFADSDIIVREDEPSSLIAFSLASQDYQMKLQKFRERATAAEQRRGSVDMLKNNMEEDGEVERTMLGQTATHMKYEFNAGSARMQCKIFYAESFDAIRRKCGVAERFVESLSRCLKWDSKGGKTRSLFLRTLDERFIVKSLSPVETQAFLKFAPDYFEYMSRCLFHSLPSALAKMLGFYHVVIKNPMTGTELSYFLQVMENVFYEGPSNRMFDLKGSMRNRRVESTGEKNEVLLDENMLDYMAQSPVYVRTHSHSLLWSSITNDTLFCSKQNVMDYSLIVGLYDDRKELMVGIIDYIRTYTWDKKLESWIKDRGKHKATVRSPKEYRNRFRASIPRYFPLAPSCWQVFGAGRSEAQVVTWDSLGAEEEEAPAAAASSDSEDPSEDENAEALDGDEATE